jgi:hypothetical protein
MHLSTEGNSPSLRSQLGVGFNRALPAPFTFGNAILPDGLNDNFSIKKLIGQSIPSKISIEFWVNTNGISGAVRQWTIIGNFNGSSGVRVQIVNIVSTNSFRLDIWNAGAQYSLVSIILPDTTNKHLIAFTADLNSGIYNYYLDGQFYATSTNLASVAGLNLTNTISHAGIFLDVTGGGSPPNFKHDEIRLYNRIIGLDECLSNYNYGFGNNPAKTEGLIFWYDFEVAETEVSLYPGGSPTGWTSGAYGIRDKSGNANHGMQVNMTNNPTLGGALTPF